MGEKDRFPPPYTRCCASTQHSPDTQWSSLVGALGCPAEITRRSSCWTFVRDSLSRPRGGSLEVACGTPHHPVEAMCGVSGHPTEVARWSSPRCTHMHVTTSCLHHTYPRPQQPPRAIQIAGSVHPSELTYGIHVAIGFVVPMWWRAGRKRAGTEDPTRGEVNNWIDIRVEKMHCGR